MDALAAYLADLETNRTQLLSSEEKHIIDLYRNLHQIDKTATIYSKKSKKPSVPGPWRSSKKRGDPVPGLQAAERCA